MSDATQLDLPAVIKQANLGRTAFAQGYAWEYSTPPWCNDGSNSPIVKKLSAMSTRGALAMLAASAEWFTARIGVSHSVLAAALWHQVETANPTRLDQAQLGELPKMASASVPFVKDFTRTAIDCIDIAHKFQGALFSYIESTMRLTQFVMDAPKPFETWRRAQYAQLANAAGEFTMRAVYQRILAEAKTSNRPDYTVKKTLVAEQGIGALWGPPLQRVDLFA